MQQIYTPRQADTPDDSLSPDVTEFEREKYRQTQTPHVSHYLAIMSSPAKNKTKHQT